MASSDLYLHEELMLLTLKDREGTVVGGTNYPFAIGGAVLSELLMTGRIGVERDESGDRVQVRESTPLGDPLLDEWLVIMAGSRKPRTARDWVARIASSSDLKHRVALQLSRRGILRVAEDKVLWIFTRKIYPEVDPGPENRLEARLEEAIFRDGEVDARTAVLAALADQAGILRAFFGKDRLASRRERLTRITDGQVSARAAGEAIEAMQVALVITSAIPAIVTATIISR